MRTTSKLLLALVLLGTAGCSALDRVNDALYASGADVEPSAARAVARDCGVTVLAGGRSGRGVIVGRDRVLTVAHVMGEAREAEVGTAFAWVKATVVCRIDAEPEALVELALETGSGGFLTFTGFEDGRQAELRRGEPAYVLAASGIHGWARGLKKGDSGSPVIDERGGVVGLLVGLTSDGRGVMARTPGAAPAPAPRGDLVATTLATD